MEWRGTDRIPTTTSLGSMSAGDSRGELDSARRPQYPIESVDNALRILLLLGERRQVRLTEVSEYLSVASSTAHRLLAMLQYRGFVRQSDETRAYEPGPALTTIAFGVLRQIDVRAKIHPLLQSLSEKLGETVHLGRLDGALVTFVDSVESSRAVRVGSRLGVSMPAHCTSSGKALLAELDAETVRSIYPHEELQVLTDRSIASRTALEKQLAKVRRDGYAESGEESEEGVASVAIALGEFGGARYSVNISSPRFRMNREIQKEFVAELRDIAREAERLFL